MKRGLRGLLRAAALALVSASVSACVRVQPWQRETLARPALQQPAWPVMHAAHEHVYEVREASGGGTGSTGGGCGCN